MRKLLGLILLLSLSAWAQSPFDGTWKMDTSKTQFTSQKPDTFVLQAGQYTCSTCDPKIEIKADGSDQRVPGAKTYDTEAVKQVDDKTVQFTVKKDGKVLYELTRTVSLDGKTLTAEYKMVSAKGETRTVKGTSTRVSGPPAGAHAISGSWLVKKTDASENALTFTLKATGDGLSRSRLEGESGYDAKFDGKDYPVRGGGTTGLTVSLKKVNDNTIEETYKRDGKPMLVCTVTIEGKILKTVGKNVKSGDTFTSFAEKQ